MKYIIHIGQSKTGTSSLQSFLAINRKALRSKGFLFPDVFIGNAPLNIIEHNALADQLAGFTRYPSLSAEEYFQQFEKQAQKYNCHTIILSAESFFGAPQIWRVSDENQFWATHKVKVQALAKFVKNKDVQIIAYLRNQCDWFESALSQIIRTEGLLGHRIYEDDKQLFEFLKPHMDYKHILDLWSSEFSTEALSVIPFDKNILSNQNIIDDFCFQISLDIRGLIFPDKKENVGLDRRYIWLKNQLNQKKKRKSTERMIIALLNTLNTRLKNVKKHQIPSVLRMRIQDFYTPLNEELCIDYGIMMPNILTTPNQVKWQGDITEKEKEEALQAYKKSLYSKKSLLLFIRYEAGAFLRQYAPFLNATLKKFIFYLKQ